MPSPDTNANIDDDSCNDKFGQLARKLWAGESVEVVGVVEKGGVNAPWDGPHGAAVYSDTALFFLQLHIWSSPDIGIEKESLEILCQAAVSAMNQLFERECQMVRVNMFPEDINTEDEHNYNCFRGRLVEILSVDEEDLKLRKISNEIFNPPFVEDTHFGRLELNRKLDQLVCTREFEGASYHLFVGYEDDAYDSGLVWEMVSSMETQMQKIKELVIDFCIDRLAKNNLAILSREIFFQKIILYLVSVEKSGKLEACFENKTSERTHLVTVKMDGSGIFRVSERFY